LRASRVILFALAGSCAALSGTSSALANCGCSPSLIPILDPQLGLISVATSQIMEAGVQSNLRDVRDGIQRAAATFPGLMRYTWDPNDRDDLNVLAYAKAPPLFKAPPKPPEPTVKYAVWGMGYYDQENRTGTFAGVDIGRTTSTVGGLGGFDAAITSGTGTFVIGVLGGPTEARVRGNDGSSARVTGPGVGVYGAYVNGGWSIDGNFLANFFDIDRSAPGAVDLSISLNNYTEAVNLNDKIQLNNGWWMEPTVGFTHTSTIWTGAAVALGLVNGEQTRVTGGVRFGTSFDWNGIRVEPTIKGGLYDDVSITGATVAAAAGTAAFPTDQGKVFGQGIGKLNFIVTPNFSASLEGELRGTSGVFGAAVRGGIRIAF
jgi:hypothetical protein